ncbi:unnamed protein product [Gadus morhua 'NCC']
MSGVGLSKHPHVGGQSVPSALVAPCIPLPHQPCISWLKRGARPEPWDLAPVPSSCFCFDFQYVRPISTDGGRGNISWAGRPGVLARSRKQEPGHFLWSCHKDAYIVMNLQPGRRSICARE